MSKSNTKNTQLTSAKKYDVKKIIFADPFTGKIDGGGKGPNITYNRINISTMNPDGSIGGLVFPTGRLFSFGVQENRDKESNKINGYVLPLCLWDKEKVTKEQKEFTTTFDNIVEHCKKHLISVKEEIGEYDLEMSDLKKFNPLYWKREKGKIVKGTGPTLYAKLIYSKKNKKIITSFFDPNGETVDPMDPQGIFGKYCWVKGVIKFESIFIGNTISLQVKLYEAEVETVESGMKPLLKRPQAKTRMLTSKPNVKSIEFDSDEEKSGGEEEGDDDEKNTKNAENDDEDASSDVGSLADSGDEENPEPETPPPKKKPVKRKVRKAGK